MLLLFDIDGTLLSGATKAHSQALDRAIREVHHVDPRDLRKQIGPAGRTDGEIARLILLDLGVSAWRIDELADSVRETCWRIYAEICPPDLSDHVVPGIPEILSWLGGKNEVTLGLVTGNFEPIARLKLKRAGIGRWFAPEMGAFGSDSEDRAALPGIARRRAGRLGSDRAGSARAGIGRAGIGRAGMPVPRDQTIVIGDTPRDIACARADGVRCVAVTTGQYGPEELAGADAVARDAAELRASLEQLGV
ncbi:MAG TPA: HAD hydrolase-like protein [Solirubrobacteraceae bacterium]|nr:HAD hydrolase-like protein [Solirubrobacteraceae bacterium]